MKLIAVASTNPVKVEATLTGFQLMFPGEDFDVVTASVPSGVSHQPWGDEETLRGALNRARGAAEDFPRADYWVGIEGGVHDMDGEMNAFAWIAVLSHGLSGKSRSGTFPLPAGIADLVRQGIELGEADDIVFNRSNSKHQNGAIGILTGDVIDRMHLYQHAVILALVPFKNPELFAREELDARR